MEIGINISTTNPGLWMAAASGGGPAPGGANELVDTDMNFLTDTEITPNLLTDTET